MHERGDMSLSQFFDGADLSIEQILRYLGEAFQHWSHLCWILVFRSWQRAEMLSGRGLFSSLGNILLGLEFPCVTFFALLSAFSSGVKFE